MSTDQSTQPFKDPTKDSDILPYVVDDNVIEYGQGHRSRRRRDWRVGMLLLVLGLATAVGLAFIIKYTVLGNNHKDDGAPPANSTLPVSPNIRSLCQQVTFPDQCEAILTAIPGADTMSDADLVKTALATLQKLLGQARTFANAMLDSKVEGIPQVGQVCVDALESALDYSNETLQAVTTLLSGQQGTERTTLDDLMTLVSSMTYLNKECGVELIPYVNNTADSRTNLLLSQVLVVSELVSNSFSLMTLLTKISPAFALLQNQTEAALDSDPDLADPFPDLDLPTGDAFAPASRRLLEHIKDPMLHDTLKTWLEEDGENFPEWMRRMLPNINDPKYIVAKNGGNFRKVQDAVNKVGKGQAVIRIKAGRYTEKVQIKKGVSAWLICDPGAVIEYDDSVRGGTNTGNTFTVGIYSNNVVVMNCEIANTAGKQGGQAVALRASGDKQAYYKVTLRGYQDTLLAAIGRQLYKKCTIIGAVDYIFGAAAAIFDRCNLLSNGRGAISANGRTDPNDPSAYVFYACRIGRSGKGIADGARNGVNMAGGNYQVSFGRAWRAAARTVFIRCYLPDYIEREGWSNWDKSTDDIYYGEYKNYGPGACTGCRVRWARTLNRYDLRRFSHQRMLDINSWDFLPFSYRER